jgi:hypothetical protein
MLDSGKNLFYGCVNVEGKVLVINLQIPSFVTLWQIYRLVKLFESKSGAC